MTAPRFGVSYYPELHLPQDRTRHVRLIAEAGFDTVRMAEFAWVCMEPAPGVFDWSWLDEAMELCAAHRLGAVLCTPSAAPPRWLSDRMPDLLLVDNQGRTRPPGGRRQYCHHHLGYRSECARIAAAMAERYGRHGALVGWQIDNEYAQEATGRSQSAAARAAFRAWLERRYGDIDALNRAYGNAFWGRTFQGFGQVEPPISTIEPCTRNPIEHLYDNPSLRLDWERFSSLAWCDFQRPQVEAIRARSSAPITHNSTGTYTNSIDLWQLGRDLDVHGIDTYPDLRSGTLDLQVAEYAFARGVKAGKGFWVLEASSGGGHALWEQQGRLQPLPGALGQMAVQAVASGAELFAHFPFLAFSHGAEQLNYAILDADAVPRRRYREVQRTAADLRRLAPWIAATAIRARIAVLFDYDSYWALRLKPVHRQWDYAAGVRSVVADLAHAGLEADVVGPDADLAAYRLLISPTPVVMGEPMRERLRAWTAAGGHWLTLALTAVKDIGNGGERRSLPAGLDDLFGCTVAEVEPVLDDTVLPVEGAHGAGRTATWLELLEPHAGAEVVARVAGAGWRAGTPVAVRHAHGRGRTWYLGSLFDAALRRRILVAAALAAGAEALPFALPERILAVRRTGPGGAFYLLTNDSADPVTVRLHRGLRDLLAGTAEVREVVLPGRGYAALAEWTGGDPS